MEISSLLQSRMQDYCSENQIETETIVGSGLDGVIWQTSRQTALKIHRNSQTYERERDAYLRLKKRAIRRLSGFFIPVLCDHDDQLLALEMTMVPRPFVLDFAEARLDASFPQLESAEWIEMQTRVYGRDWPDVRRVLDALLQYGIAFHDVHPGNISLRR